MLRDALQQQRGALLIRGPQRVCRSNDKVLTRFRARQVICPSCQNVAGNSLAMSGKSEAIFRASRAPQEGRFAVVTKRWARDAMDALAAQDERRESGRRS